MDDRLSESAPFGNQILSALSSINTIMLYRASLTPLICSFGLVREEPCSDLRLRSMVKRECKYLGTDATIVFAVRRAGCGACRLNARTLTAIAKQDKVSLVGVVKEKGDFTALSEFHSKYFGQFPLYKDSKWEVFDSLGGRKISTWTILRKGKKLSRTFKENNIRNISFGGDARTLGGIFLFDRRGDLRYTYYEKFGEELRLDELRTAIATLRGESIVLAAEGKALD